MGPKRRKRKSKIEPKANNLTISQMLIFPHHFNVMFFFHFPPAAMLPVAPIKTKRFPWSAFFFLLSEKARLSLHVPCAPKPAISTLGKGFVCVPKDFFSADSIGSKIGRSRAPRAAPFVLPPNTDIAGRAPGTSVFVPKPEMRRPVFHFEFRHLEARARSNPSWRNVETQAPSLAGDPHGAKSPWFASRAPVAPYAPDQRIGPRSSSVGRVMSCHHPQARCIAIGCQPGEKAAVKASEYVVARIAFGAASPFRA